MQTCTKWSPFLSVALPSKRQGQTCEALPLTKELLAVYSKKKPVIYFESCSDLPVCNNLTYMHILATLFKLSFFKKCGSKWGNC